MESVSRLANHIERTLDGPMWHGPALLELLNGVSPADAGAHPVTGAHSIWELVLHMAVWAEIVRLRLTGQALESPPPSEDWPEPAAAGIQSWTATIARLDKSYRDLARAVGGLSPADLAVSLTTAHTRHTMGDMLHGVIEHGVYHGGQIAILKRALA